MPFDGSVPYYPRRVRRQDHPMFAHTYCVRCGEVGELDEDDVCGRCREDEGDEEADHRYRKSIGD